MAQIDLRLSTLQQANGTHEILIRFYQGSKFNLRAKSGVSIEPDYFEYTINWAKTLKAGISMPKKMIRTSTLSNATKKGYVLNGAGDIVINEQRVLSNAVKREIQEKQNKIKLLKDFIMKSYESADKTDVKGDWLKLVVDKFNNPKKYIHADTIKELTFYCQAELYLTQKQFSYDHTKGFRVLVRAVARYEGFRRYEASSVVERRNLSKVLADDEKFKFDPETVTRDDIEDFRDYLRNEKELSSKYNRFISVH